MTFNRRSLLTGMAGAAVLSQTSVSLPARAAKPAPSDIASHFGPPDGVALLARNENPYGPSPAARKALADTASKGAYYADESYLASMIAERHGVTPDHIAIGTGSGEVLCAIAQAWTRDGKSILGADLFWDTTAKYAVRQGAEIVRVPMGDQVSVDLGAMKAAVNDSIGLVHITNPNNPTGQLLDAAELKSFCEFVEGGTTVLVDEAYNELTDDPDANTMVGLVREGKNIIIARTFSKIYGMAGVRVGYSIARPDITEKIKSNVMSWMGVPQLAAAIASYNDQEFLTFSKAKIVEGREMVMEAVKANGLTCLPSATNFVYVDVGQNAEEFRKKMAAKKVMIRGIYQDYTNWSRVSMGFIEDVERYVKALPEALAG